MSDTIIQIEDLFHHGGQAKFYRLGTMGGRRLADDLHRWWAKVKVRGKPDPLLKIGQEDQDCFGQDNLS